MLNNTNRFPYHIQFIVSVVAIVLTSVVFFFFTDIMGHRTIALLLLLVVSLLAMFFDILPVLLAAVLSALIWNFFFIPPIFTFHIDNTEDMLMFLMYFMVALLNAVLTFKIRDREKILREKEKKEDNIKLYNTVLNSLSHELRTPISTIIGATDVIKENNSQLTETHKTNLLTEIESAAFRLNQQVENLLNMSRLENDMLQLKKDWCNINELIFSIIRKVDIPKTEHKIIFWPDESVPLFKIDAALIEQALYNIIHNAILYTPSDSVIIISAAYKKGYCLLVVSDNGPGIPEQEIPSVFDKFFRLPFSKTGGTGLGLSIAKGFVQAHDGIITLENIESGGARFSIEIPTETSYINHLKNE